MHFVSTEKNYRVTANSETNCFEDLRLYSGLLLVTSFIIIVLFSHQQVILTSHVFWNTRQKSPPEILTPVFRADARLLTSSTAFGPQRQSMTLEVVHQHEKRVPECGVEFRSMAPISGADVRGLRLSWLLVKFGPIRFWLLVITPAHHMIYYHTVTARTTNATIS